MFKLPLLLLLKCLCQDIMLDNEADEVNLFMYILKLTFIRFNKFHIPLIWILLRVAIYL